MLKNVSEFGKLKKCEVSKYVSQIITIILNNVQPVHMSQLCSKVE